MRSCRARGKSRSPPMPSSARQAVAVPPPFTDGGTSIHQLACKPGSVRRLAPSRRPFLWDVRCRTPRATYPGGWPGNRPELTLRAAPIRSCSRWGLPCRSRCRDRGGLLPHPFTLARRRTASPCGLAAPGARQREGGRFAFCGTFPGVAPAGRYPAPCFHGARTFLPGGLSTLAGAAVQPAGSREIGVSGAPRQGLAGSAAIRRSSVAMVDRSAIPSTRSGRKWR